MPLCRIHCPRNLLCFGRQTSRFNSRRPTPRWDAWTVSLPCYPIPVSFSTAMSARKQYSHLRSKGRNLPCLTCCFFENDQAPGVPIDDVQEVSNYAAALEHGLKRIKEGFPLSLRLVKELHAILLSKGRGSQKLPGEFRTSQNWLGGTRPGNARFVPPPPDKLLDC